jgi:hypothetical protein
MDYLSFGTADFASPPTVVSRLRNIVRRTSPVSDGRGGGCHYCEALLQSALGTAINLLVHYSRMAAHQPNEQGFFGAAEVSTFSPPDSQGLTAHLCFWIILIKVCRYQFRNVGRCSLL